MWKKQKKNLHRRVVIANDERVYNINIEIISFFFSKKKFSKFKIFINVTMFFAFENVVTRLLLLMFWFLNVIVVNNRNVNFASTLRKRNEILLSRRRCCDCYHEIIREIEYKQIKFFFFFFQYDFFSHFFCVNM